MLLCEPEPPRKSDPAAAGPSGGLEALAPLCYSQEGSLGTLRCSTQGESDSNWLPNIQVAQSRTLRAASADSPQSASTATTNSHSTTLLHRCEPPNKQAEERSPIAPDGHGRKRPPVDVLGG